ncbi:MAG TPA: GxxExxY protein [Candidatus Limnocylindrales bacterium]|nr:GxxExxY protein [Candidatus Limnocylindrales bacterium]
MYSEITDKIINSFYKVYNVLGYGFLEKIYENALVIELESAGFVVLQQQNIKVYYENQVVGDYFADIIVNDLVILEIKAAEGLRDENKAHLINYLKATNKQVGLLFNFGKKSDFKRAIFSNERREISEAEHQNPCVSALSASSVFHSSG